MIERRTGRFGEDGAKAEQQQAPIAERQKERLPQGSFLPWIEAEFGMSADTANRVVNVATRLDTKSRNVRDLPATALYELAALSTPQTIRDHVEALVVDGAKVTAADSRQTQALGSGSRQKCGSLIWRVLRQITWRRGCPPDIGFPTVSEHFNSVQIR